MPRKKKEATEEYDILIGFVHDFKFFNQSHIERMNGHPETGRCYRLIKDPSGYRLHIGRENNSAGLDGLFLGKDLDGERPEYVFTIEVITPSNYLALPFINEDAEKIVEWLATENKDLWEGIKKEQSGAVPVVRSLADLLNLIRKAQQKKSNDRDAPLELRKGLITHVSSEDETGIVPSPSYRTSERISNALNYIQDTDPAMILSLADVLDYIAASLRTSPNKMQLESINLISIINYKIKKQSE